MKKYILPLLTGAALTLAACSGNDTAPAPVQPEAEAAKTDVIFTINDFISADGGSRIAATPSDDGATFAWEATDTIGILPDEGAQVYFAIKELTEDASSATFTGGAWGLKAENEYTAYYPFIQDIMLKRTAVPVDYSVQTYKHRTDGVVNPSHDYMAARSVKAESGGLNFQFSHLGALVEVKFTLPEAATVKRFYLTASEAIFPVKGTFDLTTSETVAITPDNTALAYSVAVDVEDLATTETNQTVSVFFMMPPVSADGFSTKNLTATVVYGENNATLPLQITTEKTSLDAETYYTLEATAIDISEENSPYIESYFGEELSEKMRELGCTKLRFVTGSTLLSENEICDPEVDEEENSRPGAYGVKNGDWLEVHTRGKEFALPEDAANNMFYGNDFMTEIDLTGINTAAVTDMNNMFYECSSLESITFGSGFNTEKVTDMNYMFNRCSSLTSLDLSKFNTDQVMDMNGMFGYCSSLTSLDLSSFNTAQVTNMNCMFEECSSLTSLNLSNFDTKKVTDMGWMFNNCPSLTSLDLSSFTFVSSGCDYTYMFDNVGYDSYQKDNTTKAKIYVSSEGKTVLTELDDDEEFTLGLDYATLEVKQAASTSSEKKSTINSSFASNSPLSQGGGLLV